MLISYPLYDKFIKHRGRIFYMVIGLFIGGKRLGCYKIADAKIYKSEFMKQVTPKFRMP
jgi:hypothetical protein